MWLLQVPELPARMSPCWRSTKERVASSMIRLFSIPFCNERSKSERRFLRDSRGFKMPILKAKKIEIRQNSPSCLEEYPEEV